MKVFKQKLIQISDLSDRPLRQIIRSRSCICILFLDDWILLAILVMILSKVSQLTFVIQSNACQNIHECCLARSVLPD